MRSIKELKQGEISDNKNVFWKSSFCIVLITSSHLAPQICNTTVTILE